MICAIMTSRLPFLSRHGTLRPPLRPGAMHLLVQAGSTRPGQEADIQGSEMVDRAARQARLVPQGHRGTRMATRHRRKHQDRLMATHLRLVHSQSGGINLKEAQAALTLTAPMRQDHPMLNHHRMTRDGDRLAQQVAVRRTNRPKVRSMHINPPQRLKQMRYTAVASRTSRGWVGKLAHNTHQARNILQPTRSILTPGRGQARIPVTSRHVQGPPLEHRHNRRTHSTLSLLHGGVQRLERHQTDHHLAHSMCHLLAQHELYLSVM